MSTFARAWAGQQLRRRWPAMTVLTLLIALATTTVFAALAGARRQASAEQRLVERTLPADAAILANTAGYPWAQVRALPEVSRLATFGIVVPVVGLPPEAEAEPIIGRDMLRTIERPAVRDGRMFDPTRIDEAVAAPGFLEAFDRNVGDVVEVVLPTLAELRAQEGSGPGGAFTGPRLHPRIVGEVVSPWYHDLPGTPGGLLLSPAVTERYRPNVLGDSSTPVTSRNALVRLRGGAADIPRLLADLDTLRGTTGVDVWDLRERFQQPAQRQATFTARCLLAFGIAAFVAALVLVGSVLARHVSVQVDELLVLRPLGLTPSDGARAAAVAPVAAALLGVGLGTLGAVLVSDWLPIGAARLVEPTPGRSVDWTVFAPGIAVIVLLVGAGAAVLAARSWRAAVMGNRSVNRSAIVGRLFRSGAPVAAVLGARLALEPGVGIHRVPVRATMVAVVAGILGVVGAVTFSHGVSDAAEHPERFGQTYQLTAFLGFDGHDFVPSDRLRTALEDDPEVTGLDDVRVAIASAPDGAGSVTLLTYTWGPKALPAVLTAGRLPTAADEVMLTPTSLDDLDTEVGGSVTLDGTSGSNTFTVVGSGFVPTGFHNGYADGGWLTDAGYDALFDSARFHLAYVAVRDGANAVKAAQALTSSITKDHRLGAVAFAPADPVPAIFELRDVRQLPRVLGAFLAVLAAGAAGFAVISAVRRRRAELAVLRALGMSPRQAAAAVATQASLIALIGLVLGIPLGFAVARTIWEGVADSYPFEYRAPWTAACWLVVPAALLLTNLLAVWPAIQAARLRVADVLRAE